MLLPFYSLGDAEGERDALLGEPFSWLEGEGDFFPFVSFVGETDLRGEGDLLFGFGDPLFLGERDLLRDLL